LLFQKQRYNSRVSWIRLSCNLILLVSLLGTPTSKVFSFQSSVLATGDWYKIGVTKNGVYKIDQAFLLNAGIDVNGLDPLKIRIFGNGGKMLPQKNSAPRPFDLIENAIYVSGEADGTFNSTDFVLFYGQGPDEYGFGNAVIEFENNLYSDTSYYFININQAEGLRVEEVPSLAGNYPVIDNFNDIQAHEIDAVNVLQQPITSFAGSGREWYGEIFFNQLNQTFDFNFEGLQNSQIELYSSLMAASPTSSTFTIGINDFVIGDLEIQPIPNTRYGVKGVNRLDTFSIPGMLIGGSSNTLSIHLEYTPGNSGQSIGYLNYLAISAKRALALYGSQTLFRSLESLQNPISTFSIQNFATNSMVWNISVPTQPTIQNTSIGQFSSETSILKSFVVFEPSLLDPPVYFGSVGNQNIKNLSDVELLIITHPSLQQEAQRLADFRNSNDNLNTSVVNIHQVYNEFSSGSKDPTAFRDFVHFLFSKPSERKLKFLLLFGRTSYDYKNRTDGFQNLVPTYLSRNSLDPLKTYSSDDYFGFLDPEEGLWIETSAGDEISDIGIGRIPVKTVLEAKLMVDKLIRYASTENSLGKWKNEIVFIADDGDNNTHQRQADILADLVGQSFPEFIPTKFYLDAFPQIKNPGSEE